MLQLASSHKSFWRTLLLSIVCAIAFRNNLGAVRITAKKSMFHFKESLMKGLLTSVQRGLSISTRVGEVHRGLQK